jgi:hypothetical protein
MSRPGRRCRGLIVSGGTHANNRDSCIALFRIAISRGTTADHLRYRPITLEEVQGGTSAVEDHSTGITPMADVRALRFLGLSLSAATAVVMFAAAITVSQASKVQSETAAIAARVD